MKKLLLIVLSLAAAGVILWGVARKNAPPTVNFKRAKRITLVSTLPTNGKVEPFEWQAVRAETEGTVSRVPVREGQTVSRGAVLAEMLDPALAADIRAGEAKLAEAQAELASLESGGRPAELAVIENSLARARFELQQQQQEYNSLRRLAEKQAATRVEVQAAHDKIEQSQIEIAGLEKRRAAMVGKTDVAAARARVQAAEAALGLARERATRSMVRSPMAGQVYGLDIRPGSYLNPGDLVANVGVLDRLRVRVYVDEPELGRVAEGQPVTITWQALSGKEWSGMVLRKPTAIEALGSRQVGQVVCIIENAGRELIPGTNVDAVIRTAVVENALVVPKEVLRHDQQGEYLFVLKGDTVERRPVKTGQSSVTQIQITQGLTDGDAVAMPSDVPLQSGERVTAVI
ncbi:MAG TPA: efflux RND transporter periplasmic adaptor subunit [Bryobacteraceae bacterium]